MKEKGLSLKHMESMQTYIRGVFGRKSVEPYAQKKLVKMTHEMDEYYEVEDREFVEIENKVPKPILRTLVVVKEASEIIYDLHNKLDLDIHDSYMKVGFDYGGECLKASTESAVSLDTLVG